MSCGCDGELPESDVVHCAGVTCAAETLDPWGEGWIPVYGGKAWICRRCAWLDMML